MFKYGIEHLTASKAIQLMNASIKGTIDVDTQAKIKACHANVMAIANGESPVYGINTGFGPLCNVIIAKEKTGELQRNLLLSHSVGVGDLISQELAKLMLILKVHALSKGFSGISMQVLDRIMYHIDNDLIPCVPSQGSVGASGDLAPLSHLFLPLIGEGYLIENGKKHPTKDLLKKHNLIALELDPKSALALINGTQFIAAHAIKIVEKLHNCLSHSDLIGALMIEGLLGSKSPFDEDLHKIRPYKGNIHVAARMRNFLKDSEIMASHKLCDKVQDPYSLRCIPQVHGSSRNAWVHLKESLEIEINSVTDNPIVFSKDRTVSGGNFHGQPMALPIDYACLAAAELGNISDRRAYLSLEGKTEGVPKLLFKETGLMSGFMILQYTGAALVSENKGLCFPSSADSIPTSLGQEDHVSMGSIGSRKALKVCENLENILAVELVCAAQALDFHRPLKSSGTLENVHELIRQTIPFADKDRIFSEDINKARDLIQSKAILELIQQKQYSEFDEMFEQY